MLINHINTDIYQTLQIYIIFITCTKNEIKKSLWGSIGEHLTHRQSALMLKISGFICFVVNLEKMISKTFIFQHSNLNHVE